MRERMLEDVALTTAMEDMLVDALVFGGPAMLRGVTYKALKRRDLAEPTAGSESAAQNRRLTADGARFAREIARERADDQTITSEMLRDLASTAGLTITSDGRTLIDLMDDKAASAAEHAAERGAGCGPTCGCGSGQ